MTGKIKLLSFKNFCPYNIDLEEYKKARSEFSIDEWINIILGAVDYNASGYQSEEEKLTMITRILPFVEKRLNLIELAPKGNRQILFIRQCEQIRMALKRWSHEQSEDVLRSDKTA